MANPRDRLPGHPGTDVPACDDLDHLGRRHGRGHPASAQLARSDLGGVGRGAVGHPSAPDADGRADRRRQRDGRLPVPDRHDAAGRNRAPGRTVRLAGRHRDEAGERLGRAVVPAGLRGRNDRDDVSVERCDRGRADAGGRGGRENGQGRKPHCPICWSAPLSPTRPLSSCRSPIRRTW